MRVAIDTTYAALGPSGTAVYIDQLIPALEAEGIDVVRLRNPGHRKRGGRNKLRSAANAISDLAWTKELLPKAAERAKADVLHHPLPARSPTKIAQVITVHDVAYAHRPDDFDPLWRRVALRSHRSATAGAGAVIAVSDAARRDAAAWLRAPAERIIVAPHGPGQELHVDAERGEDHFLYVGDDEPRKNVKALREAYARYRASGGAMKLVLAGAAGERVDGAGLADLHGRAMALVHPSKDEGFGLTILEAMAAGTPVIAARNAAVEELAAEAALIVDDWALAEAMQRVERDPRLRNAMGEAGRRRAAEFSWQRSAKAHIEAYTLARNCS